jgi:hypothetical protein
MTEAQLRSAIEEAIEAVDFVAPITIQYCAAVRDALRARAHGAELDVYFRQSELVVEARLGKRKVLFRLPLV